MSVKDFKRASHTGIDVLIVGGGIAGMTCAIEAHRKGHNVRMLERYESFEGLGDILALGSSVFQTIKKWPGFVARLKSMALRSEIHFHRYDGSWLADAPKLAMEGREPSTALSRAHAHDCLHDYCKKLGILMIFGQYATGYSEDGSKGFVTLSDGSVLSADVVVAADGVGSKSHALLSNDLQSPISSGYAIFRASYPLEDAMADPCVKAHWGDKEEHLSIILGPDVHLLIGKNDARNTMCWMLTHKDVEGTSQESWKETTEASAALKFVPDESGWADYVRALIKTTTNDRCIDWRLMWRDPQPLWHSPQGRVVQIGDACHPFLPTSGSGAVMAMEDAYSLVACLQIAGKEQIPLAVQVHNRLRFERVSCAQKMGFKTRDQWHKPNYKFIEDHPEEALRYVGKWIYQHDSEEYAYENFGKCVNHILNKAEFRNTNIPLGYEYEPWTAKELVSMSAAGQPIVDLGDWS